MDKGKLPGKPISLWLDTTPGTNYPPLTGDLTTEVLIVGGGIAGLSTAEHLASSGLEVTLIDGNRILEGVTGFTTAKVTSLHTLIYRKLIDRFGKEMAQQYANANQWAIGHIRGQVAQHGIDCDFTEEDAFTYATYQTGLQSIDEEIDAAQSLGLPVSLADLSSQKFLAEAAICMKGQARFHPRKYLLHLAEKFIESGGTIYEHTRALKAEEHEGFSDVYLSTGVIRCRYLVIATHFPFQDDNLYFTKLAPYRSYALAARIDGPLPDGMFIGVDEPVRSLRRQSFEGEDILLVGGEGHKVGQEPDTNARYFSLAEWTRETFKVKEFLYRWSTQDNQTPDGVPYIGLASHKSENVFIATGFDGWGMTTGTFAGKLIADLIQRIENPWAKLFDPNRSELKSLGVVIKEGANVAKQVVTDFVEHIDRLDLSSLKKGDGEVFYSHTQLVAASRDDQGTVHLVSAKCTHMGCNLHWNRAEQSWDCPCHGSRFDPDGKVLHGPAVENLEQVVLHERDIESKVTLL